MHHLPFFSKKTLPTLRRGRTLKRDTFLLAKKWSFVFLDWAFRRRRDDFFPAQRYWPDKRLFFPHEILR